MGADVQLSRVQIMRLRMRRQLDAQLACTSQKRLFLSEEVDLMDVEFGVGAFVNKYPPTINAGQSDGAHALVHVRVCVLVHVLVYGLV